MNRVSLTQSVGASKGKKILFWILGILVGLIILIVGCSILITKTVSNALKNTPISSEDGSHKAAVTTTTGPKVLLSACNKANFDYLPPLDEMLATVPNIQWQDLSTYEAQGYRLRGVCNYGNTIVLFFDFEKGYWEKAGKISDEQQYALGRRIAFGLTDNAGGRIYFYPTTADNYRLEGPGGSSCHLDGYDGTTIRYICSDGGEDGHSREWYVYDTQQLKSTKVQYIYRGSVGVQDADGQWTRDTSRDKKQIFDSNLLKLFSDQGIQD